MAKSKAQWRLESTDAKDAAKAIMNKAKDEDRELTVDERKDVDAYTDTAEKAETMVKQIEADDERAIRLAKIEESMSKPALVERPQPRARIEFSGEHEPWEDFAVHGGSIAFTGPHAKRDAYLSGQWLLWRIAGESTEVGKRAARMCREYGMLSREERALATNVNASGGFLVPTPMESTIIELREQYGVFRQNARVLPMSSDTIQIPRYSSGATVYWPGEGASITESTAAFDSVTITAKKIACLTKMSSEISEDAVISMASWVAKDFAMQFAYTEDNCGFNGDGSATYGGIYGIRNKIHTDSHAVGSIDATGGDNLPEVTTDDLATVVAALPQYARANAKWYASGAADAVIFGALQMAAGGATGAELAGGPVRRFWGYPVVISQVLPAGITTDYSASVMILFGDLSLSSTLGSRRDIRFEVLTELYSGNDQIGLKGTQRFDIVNHNVGDSTAAGPIVALEGAD